VLSFCHLIFSFLLPEPSLRTIVNPLDWVREVETQDSPDLYSREISSVAFCEGDHALAYVLVLAFIQFTCLILANWWAYVSRHIETECNESLYIGLSTAAVLQAWAMVSTLELLFFSLRLSKFRQLTMTTLTHYFHATVARTSSRVFQSSSSFGRPRRRDFMSSPGSSSSQRKRSFV